MESLTPAQKEAKELVGCEQRIYYKSRGLGKSKAKCNKKAIYKCEGGRMLCAKHYKKWHLKRYGQIVKPSKEWQQLDNSGIVILDPDGWDRSNYQFSFNEEMITEVEYQTRKMMSTCAYAS